jgi:hypothetical protein
MKGCLVGLMGDVPNNVTVAQVKQNRKLRRLNSKAGPDPQGQGQKTRKDEHNGCALYMLEQHTMVRGAVQEWSRRRS